MSTFLTQGIILRRSDYREYDRQYIIMTREAGKVLAMARGVKKLHSKLNSHLDYFLLIDLMLAPGLNNFSHIGSAQIKISYNQLKTNPILLAAAEYFMSAVDNLLIYNHKDELIFDLLQSYLADLDCIKTIQDCLFLNNKYLYELLSHLGYRPQIKARNQRGLALQLYRSTVVASEKELILFSYFYNILSKFK